MPGPVTHLLFYRRLKSRLGADLCALPGYDACSIFAQGHDLLIYHDFYKIVREKQLARNLKASDQLQEFLFPQFVFNYLCRARELGVLDHEQIQLFLGPGYIAHHILDARTHPFIIYQTGDHTRDPKNKTWMHGIMENAVDILLLDELYPGQQPGRRVYRDFAFSPKQLDPALPAVLEASLQQTYGFAGGGRALCRAMSQVSLFMRVFKYDPTGLKRRLFDGADPLLKGTAAFSYHRSKALARPFLNEDHQEWCNPMDNTLRSRASFFELYDRALDETACILRALSPLYRQQDFTWDTVRGIIPDIASTHGLACGQPLVIRYTKARPGPEPRSFHP